MVFVLKDILDRPGYIDTFHIMRRIKVLLLSDF